MQTIMQDEEVTLSAETDTITDTVGSKPKQVISIEHFEPGVLIKFKCRRNPGVLNSLVKDQFDLLVVPNGTVGVPYKLDIALNGKELATYGNNVELTEATATPSLQDLGLDCCLDSESTIKISGTPTKDFIGTLFFGIIFNCWEEDSEQKSIKGEWKNFADLPQECVLCKPFAVNASPRSLWNDFPVDDYEGYENSDNESNGEIVEYLPAKKNDGNVTNVLRKCYDVAKRCVSTKKSVVSETTELAREFEVIVASARGRSHAHIGKPRDDAFHFEFDKETGWNFVAVADGAGSAKYSRKGSELATKSVIGKLRATLTKEFTDTCFPNSMIQQLEFSQSESRTIRNLPGEKENEFVEKTKIGQVFHLAVDAAYRAIYEEHKQREGSTLKDYHTTLLCAAFRWFPELNAGKGGWFIASYWIGDGGAAIIRPAGDNQPNEDRVLVLGEPDGGEFAGQTRFLTMSEEINAEKIRSRCRFSFCDSFEAMLFVTDGITDPFFPSEASVVDGTRWLEFYEEKLKNGCEEEQEGCKEIFEKIDPKAKAEKLLRWLGFWSKGNHDDRTILIVQPR